MQLQRGTGGQEENLQKQGGSERLPEMQHKGTTVGPSVLPITSKEQIFQKAKAHLVSVFSVFLRPYQSVMTNTEVYALALPFLEAVATHAFAQHTAQEQVRSKQYSLRGKTLAVGTRAAGHAESPMQTGRKTVRKAAEKIGLTSSKPQQKNERKM
jgi:hypothetical protein